MPAVLDYNRPLPPGTVRIIHRRDGGVTVLVVPDTAKRILYAILLPVLVLGAISLCAITSLLARGGLGFLLIAIVLVASGGWKLSRVLRRANEPIVFRADPELLQIHNPLDRPIDHTVRVSQIVTVQLRRTSLPIDAVLFQLEVLLKPSETSASPKQPLSLLVSPSFETIDKIGRTLLTAMRLPDPSPGPMGWWSDPQAPLVATPSSPPPPQPSPDPVC